MVQHMGHDAPDRFGGEVRRSERPTAQAVRWQRRPGMHADGRGLYLLVGRRGTKSWIYRYRRDGRLHDMGLGSSA
jgi:hypothetical protein